MATPYGVASAGGALERMNQQSFEAVLKHATARTSELAFAMAQAAAGVFCGVGAFLSRAETHPFETIALGISAAGLMVAAWSRFDRIQDIRLSRRDFRAWRGNISLRMTAIAMIGLLPGSLAAGIGSFWAGRPLAALALVASVAMWATTAGTRLRESAHHFATTGEEREGGIATGVTLLAISLILTWALARIDQAIAVGARSVPILSYLGPLAVALFMVLLLFFPRLLRDVPARVLRLAMATAGVPLLALLMVPIPAAGDPGVAMVPEYLHTLAGRLLLALVVTVAIVHFVTLRKEER